MKNPLWKRLPRSFKQDFGRYAALSLFLIMTIGFVSGFLVADGSMKTAYDQSFDKYNIEDGHFTLAMAMDDSLKETLEDMKISVDPLYYTDVRLANDHTLRIYSLREKVNKADVLSGKMPALPDEIAIDRLYAQNNGLAIGDSLKFNDRTYQITGLVALSDYSALFKNNSDMMLDANRFCVAVVSEDGFSALAKDDVKYCYAWTYQENDLSDEKMTAKSDEIKDTLISRSVVTDFVKRQDNQAITFTGEDMGSDKVMVTWILYIIIVVLAFVFAVTARSEIEQEAGVIGTLLASGYTRQELLAHYLAMPIGVTLVSAIFGNILGYTWMKEIVVGMYYHSYSLPGYTTIWNLEAFILTTLIPALIILAVNVLVLGYSLSLSPMQFLRHDLKRTKQTSALHLPSWRFLTRFRMRIIIQNKSAYLTMFFGILLANLLLMFGLCMSPLLENFKDEVIHSEIASCQYILKAPVPTNQAGAEKISVTYLDEENREEIMVYGIHKDSNYLADLSFPEAQNEVIISEGYRDKCQLDIGDTIVLKKTYEKKSYTFKVAGFYPYAAALTVFMDQSAFNETFDLDPDMFSGYFSDKKITDIDESFVATLITQEDLTVIADQLDDSMGMMFPLLGGFALFLYMLLIYLLSKMVIEKNTAAISLVKILGYTDKEAGKLYNHATAIVAIFSLLITLPICERTMKIIYQVMMTEINGWLTYYIAGWIYPVMFVMGLGCYLIVHQIEMRKVARVPMGEILKTVD